MVVCFVQKNFFGQELEYLFFLSHQARIFFQNLTLGYLTKTLNQIIFFFPPPKSEYFFQQYWESEYFFTKKPITPPHLPRPALLAITYLGLTDTPGVI